MVAAHPDATLAATQTPVHAIRFIFTSSGPPSKKSLARLVARASMSGAPLLSPRLMGLRVIISQLGPTSKRGEAMTEARTLTTEAWHQDVLSVSSSCR
jgi:hypothetical protein